jgi:hypothetical protein
MTCSTCYCMQCTCNWLYLSADYSVHVYCVLIMRCTTGYYPFTANICSPVCPDGWADIGISCTKPTSTRGVGVPLPCVSSFGAPPQLSCVSKAITDFSSTANAKAAAWVSQVKQFNPATDGASAVRVTCTQYCVACTLTH